jgi:hypothetical protein
MSAVLQHLTLTASGSDLNLGEMNARLQLASAALQAEQIISGLFAVSLQHPVFEGTNRVTRMDVVLQRLLFSALVLAVSAPPDDRMFNVWLPPRLMGVSAAGRSFNVKPAARVVPVKADSGCS